MKNRMREIRTSGSVGDEGGNVLVYPARGAKIGLLVDFVAPTLKDGLKPIMNGAGSLRVSASPRLRVNRSGAPRWAAFPSLAQPPHSGYLAASMVLQWGL